MEIDQSKRLTEVVNSLMCLSRFERGEIFKYVDDHFNDPALNNASSVVVDSGMMKSGLTNRQQEVLTLVANGYTRREISTSLRVSINTVSSHIKNIYDKLEISSKADATRMAVALGLLVVSEDIGTNREDF